MKISLITPTRGRVDKCKRYLESIAKTAAHPENIEALFYVDSDDPEIKNYMDMLAHAKTYLNPMYVGVMPGKPIGVSLAWNELAKLAGGDVIGMGNDDLIYTAPAWDVRLGQEVAGIGHGIWCSWFYDGIANSKSWPTFPMISRRYYEIVGYFAPTAGFKFFYNDTWVGDVSAKAKCQVPILSPQYLFHIHHSQNPLERDATTDWSRRNNAAQYDTKLFADTVGLRDADAKKLRDAMGATLLPDSHKSHKPFPPI